jgi:hypothetical protein
MLAGVDDDLFSTDRRGGPMHRRELGEVGSRTDDV